MSNGPEKQADNDLKYLNMSNTRWLVYIYWSDQGQSPNSPSRVRLAGDVQCSNLMFEVFGWYLVHLSSFKARNSLALAIFGEDNAREVGFDLDTEAKATPQEELFAS